MFCSLTSKGLGRYALKHDKAGAKAILAAEIFVTAGLIDSALDTKIGFQWLNRNAVTFQPTIATAFTNAIINHNPFRRVWELTLLPPPPFLSRAGLNVNQTDVPGTSRSSR